MQKSIVSGSPRAICLVGNPGSGKGTQAALLSKLLKVPVSVAGDAFRTEATQNTPRGRRIKKCLENGDEVEMQDWRPLAWQDVGDADTERGLVVDGWLRFPKQLSEMEAILQKVGLFELCFLYLDVPAQVCISRLLERKRSDDERPKILRRLGWSTQWTPPLLELAQQRHQVITINGNQEKELIHREIVRELVSVRDQLQLSH